MELKSTSDIQNVQNVSIRTFDDLLEKFGEAQDIAKELAQSKHPLALRKARVLLGTLKTGDKNVSKRQVKAGNSTYYLDIERAKNGSSYLKITQSRARGKRATIFVFPEHIDEFVEAISELGAMI